MPFHLESPWGTTLKRMCDGLGRNKIVRVGTNSGLVVSRLWTKVHEIWGRCRRPLVVVNALAPLSIKRWFWAPICRGGYTPDFGHAFSNRTYFRVCGQFWLSSVQRATRVAGDKNEDRRRRIAVKPKPADKYVGGLINGYRREQHRETDETDRLYADIER